MSLFNTDNVIDEAKLAREAVAALFDHLRREPLTIELGSQDNPIHNGSVTTALAGLSIKISLGAK